SASAGSSTTIALWPKRSKKISPGCMVITPMRGAAWRAGASASSASSNTSKGNRAVLGRANAMQAATGAASVRKAIGMHAHLQRMQSTRVGARDAEPEAAQGQFLAGFRQVADLGGHQATDGVVFVVVEVRTEALVEIRDRGQRIDRVLAIGL